MSFDYKRIAQYYDDDYFNRPGVKSGYVNMDDSVGGEWHDLACQWFNNSVPVAGKKLLDAGCGLGHFMTGFDRLGADVYGCDVSFYCEKVVRARFPDSFWRTRLEDMDEIKDESFDIVFCESTMEHIPKDCVDAVFNNLIRVTKKKGLIYLQVDTVPDSERSMSEESHVNIRKWGSWLGIISKFQFHWNVRFDLTQSLCTKGIVPGFPLTDWKFCILQRW